MRWACADYRRRVRTSLSGGVFLSIVLIGVQRDALRPPASVKSGLELVSEPPDLEASARDRLERFEAKRRRATDFNHIAPSNRTHGADPYALARLDRQHLVGILRGASALVLLSNDLVERQRIELPDSAASVAVDDSGECWIAGETAHYLVGFRLVGRALKRTNIIALPGVLGIRALSAGRGDVLYALDVHDGRLLTVRTKAGTITDSRVVGHGPISLRRVGLYLIVDLLLDHRLVVYRLNQQGAVVSERARVDHDGPMWGFDADLLATGELAIAATGVEDHPLDRSDGSFGYIDSFVFWCLLPERGPIMELWRSNVAELGVVTPKAPSLHVVGASARLFVSGYGSAQAVELSFNVRDRAPPAYRVESVVPGTSAVLRLASGALVFANPLLDAWVKRPPASAAGPELYPVEDERAPLSSLEERTGEALFFTTLMAPGNTSRGSRSRFSCETCHYEGYVDGRVHYTGRADVYATTKPLRGLFNNRPHFSRALDADLAAVARHEFRVAGQGSGMNPWFDLSLSDAPWLAQIGVKERILTAESLRQALMAYLMGYAHDQNPAVVGRSRFSDEERRGAAIFGELCARCHAARLQSDAPESALSFAAWERAIFSAAEPLVWASADYQKTGVLPYVHELGSRVPSLRRLYMKWPYFTNGSADTLTDVLTRVRYDGARFFHDHAGTDRTLRALPVAEIGDLAAFLDLL